MQRRLSTLERALELASLESPINFAMVARVEGTLDEDRLRSALSRLAPAQPTAGSVLSGTDSDSRLVFQPPVEFPVATVDSAADRDWVEATRLELMTPFDRRRDPPIRFALLHGNGWTDLVACCDHAVSDGLSAVHLMRELLHLAADPAASIAPAPEIPPSLADLVPEEVRKRLRFRLALIQLATKAALPLLRWFAHRRSARKPYNPDGFRLLAWSLDETASDRVASTARRESTTVHAAICAAFLRAFAENESNKTRRVSCPVNLRDKGSTPVGDAFGLLVGIVETSVDCSPQRPFWDVARGVKAGLNRAASPKRLWWPILVGEEALRDRDDSDLQTILGFNPKIRYDLSVTNLGRLDFTTGLRLLSLHGPAVNSLPDERILGVSTAAGRICFTFTFRDHTMRLAKAEALRDRAMAILAEAVEDLAQRR